jgi:hypothetical protein
MDEDPCIKDEQQRSTFSVSAIGVVHRPGMSDTATTDEGAYFDPFVESVVEIYPERLTGSWASRNSVIWWSSCTWIE